MNALAVLHIADLYREPKMILPSKADWKKVARYLRGEWPRPVPERIVWEPGTDYKGSVLEWLAEAAGSDYLVVDTEYTIPDKKLLVVGLGARRGGEFSGCQIMQVPRMPPWFQRKVTQALDYLAHEIPVVFQNCMADIPVLQQNWGIQPEAYTQVDDLMLAHALCWTEMPHDLEFLASLYGVHPKAKHLSQTDPATYNWMDVVDTDSAWQAVYKDLLADPQVMNVYRTRSIPLAFVLMKGHAAGIRVDREYAQQALKGLEESCEKANRKAQAAAGWPINIASSKQAIQALRWVDGIEVKTVEAEEISKQLLKHPESDIVRARREWAYADGFRKPVSGIAEQDRVYPSFLPTQATGRISVTEPALGTFPDDAKADLRGLPRLRRCVLPDPGWYWLCWDWSAMHARFMAAVSRDWADIAAYQQGIDIHRQTAALDVFGISPDQVTGRQRHLAKTIRYALLNGLDKRAVRESKEVAEQGLDMDEVERYAGHYLANKPGMVQWKAEYAARSIQARHARGLYGRKRMLMRWGERARDENAKDAISGFLQMTEVDIMVDTLVEVCRRFPECHLVYPSHDGIKLAFPVSTDPAAVVADIRPFVEREHDFFGVRMPLPAEWEIIHADGTHIAL